MSFSLCSLASLDLCPKRPPPQTLLKFSFSLNWALKVLTKLSNSAWSYEIILYKIYHLFVTSFLIPVKATQLAVFKPTNLPSLAFPKLIFSLFKLNKISTSDEAEGDFLLSAELREPDDSFNGVNIISDNDQSSLLILNKTSDVVQAVFKSNWWLSVSRLLVYFTLKPKNHRKYFQPWA